MKPNLHPLFLEGWKSEKQEIELPGSGWNNCRLFFKREDKIDPYVSGNKYRKLRYNMAEAIGMGKQCLLTFGGAYSNHIAAVASAARLCGLRSIGIIRGEELKPNSNPTLSFAAGNGMQLCFVSRKAYRARDDRDFLEHFASHPERTYLLPEGGTNHKAVRGCQEILSPEDGAFDYICVPVGTGGTLAGILKAAGPHQQVVGFSALKGNFQRKVIKRYTQKAFELTDRYCFGGYGKIDSELLRFINDFREAHSIPLDPVYTGKMAFGLLDMIQKGNFGRGARILAIHTGGLQGIAGMNQRLQHSDRPQIKP